MINRAVSIPISRRTEGMIEASADYYQESRVFRAIENAQALEYDRMDDSNTELSAQLSPMSATWGLAYWETAVGLTPRPLDDYERRRPLVLTRIINEENFSSEMIYKIADRYGADIDIIIYPADCLVKVIFKEMSPRYLKDFDAVLKDVIHAHLAAEYVVRMLLAQKTASRADIESVNFGINYISPQHSDINKLAFKTAFKSLADVIIRRRLDGKYTLDGSWLLGDELSHRGMSLHSLRLPVAVVNKHSGGISALTIRYKSGESSNRAENKKISYHATIARSNNRLSGYVTADSLYLIDGSVRLDGSRRLNARIIKEVL